jgi:hypothetical protein
VRPGSSLVSYVEYDALLHFTEATFPNWLSNGL